MLRNVALLAVAALLVLPGRPATGTEPSWPPGSYPEPELLAGVAPCRCVDIRQCPSVLEVLRRASAAPTPASVELNRLKRSTCGFHGFVPFVCCPTDNSLEPRINLAPNTIVYASPQNIHKKSYQSTYFTDDYPHHSPPYHHAFVPNTPEYPDPVSATDFQSDVPSRSRPSDRKDRTPVFHEPETSYEEEDDPYLTDDYPEFLFGTHFSNHPPHVHPHEHSPGHGPGYGLPDSPRKNPGHTAGTRKPWEPPVTTERPRLPERRREPGSGQEPTRCGAAPTKNPADVSAHSRGGPQAMTQPDPACDEPDSPGTPSTTSETASPGSREEARLEAQAAARSPGARLLPGDQCGVTVDERIVGGKEAELGAFPWVARIGYIRNGTNSSGRFLYRCGGSLLNARYVLTAAHCVTNLPGGLELATVRLGELDERSDPDCRTPTRSTCADPVQDFRPEQVTVHPQYDSPKYRNDLALIRLDRPARLSTYVSPICLPLGALAMKNYTGMKATVAGWGATNLGLTSSSPVLQWVRLGLVATTQCATAYERAAVRVDAWRQLCAGGELLSDSCEGDSGGPLMRPEQPDADSLPRYFLVGVVSFGAKNCGTESMPGVYTRVAAYLRWIVDTLQP